MAIVPDEKDWTWVLERECPECGLAAAQVAPPVIAMLARGAVPAWQAVLERADVGQRPDESTWSPLEYAAHVRDVFDLFADRIQLMLDVDHAQFGQWDQDEAAIQRDYARRVPGDVAAELASAAERFASVLSTVGDRWDRAGRRFDGTEFTVASLAQYGWHDVAHHLWDVTPRP